MSGSAVPWHSFGQSADKSAHSREVRPTALLSLWEYARCPAAAAHHVNL